MNTDNNKAKIWAALITVYIIWGSTYLAIRFAVESLPPFLMAATRFLAAGWALFTWVRLTGTPVPTRSEVKVSAIIGLLLLVGGNGLVVWAEQRVVSGITALIIGSTPLWIVLVDALRPGGVRPKPVTLLGVLIGLGGISLLISPSSLGGSDQHVDLLGAGALGLAALFWATGSVYGREHIRSLPKAPLMATALEMLAGGVGLLIIGTVSGDWGRLAQSVFTPRALGALVYLILFGSLLGYSAYTWLLGVAPTPLVATYAYVNPLVAVFLGYLLADEPLTLRVLLASGIIVGAVVLINFSNRHQQRLKTPDIDTVERTEGECVA